MRDIEALVFEFIRSHKEVAEEFSAGRIERYLDGLCRTYYGCARSGFWLMSDGKGFEIGTGHTDMHRITKKEMRDYITEFLRTE